MLISEIMYNPFGTDVQIGPPAWNKEWVEIVNTGDAPVDLSGWKLADIQDNQYSLPIPNGVSIGPKQALVLAGSAATYDAQWGAFAGPSTRIELPGFPSLDNSPSPTNEILALFDNFGVNRDTVNFSAGGSWPLLDGPVATSIFVRPEGLTAAGNDVGSNWLPGQQGLYGGVFTTGGGFGENEASPGVATLTPQAPFAPSADAAWSLAIVPDTQFYVNRASTAPNLTAMTTWINDHRAQFGVQAVVQVGDMVNQNSQTTPTSGDQTADQQWQNIRNSFSVFDGNLPYILAVGNHDLGTTDAQNRNTQFNSYFPISGNSKVDPAQGGILAGTKDPSRLENAYYRFTAPDGRDMVIFSLEFGPQDGSLAWANAVAADPGLAGSTMALVTHAYMYEDDTRYDYAKNLDSDPTNDQLYNPHIYGVHNDVNDGEEIWQQFVSQYPQMSMVMSGHVLGRGVGYLSSTGVWGNQVAQMLFNTQNELWGGAGWIRILEFLDDGKTVQVRTYSPLMNVERTDANNSFEFTIEPLGGPTGGGGGSSQGSPGDFNLNGVVDGDDLTLWRASYGAAGFNGGSLLAWQRAFGPPALPATVSVAEPSSCGLAAAVFACTGALYRARRTPRR